MATTTRRLRAALLAALACAPAQAADWTIVPSLRLRESYSDNIALQPEAAAHGELVSEIMPGIAISGHGERLDASLGYALQRVRRSTQGDSTFHNLNANASVELVEDWLYVQARSSIGRRNISAFGPQLVDPAQAGANASTVRVYSVSPELRHRLRGIARLTLRYAREVVSSDNSLVDVSTEAASVALAGDDSARGWGWNARYKSSTISDGALAPVHLRSASGTLRHGFTPRVLVFATTGYEDNDYRAVGGPAQGHFWSAGASWFPSARSSLTASVGKRFYGDTYALDASHRSRTTAWKLTYSEDITSTHSQFLALGAADTSTLLHQLWSNSIPDRARRQQAVDAFLQVARLLGPGLGDVNYLSHRYFIDKQLRASAAAYGARSSLLVNAAHSRRTAQTSSAVDSVLLPAHELSLEDRTRQRGADAVWSWRASPRTSINLAAACSQIRSLATGRTDRNTIVRAGMSRQFQPRLAGAADLRRVRHDSTAGGNYRENAVSASLSIQF